MAKIVIEIPDNFERDFLNGWFADALINTDCSEMCSDEYELVQVLIDGLEDAYLLEK